MAVQINRVYRHLPPSGAHADRGAHRTSDYLVPKTDADEWLLMRGENVFDAVN